MLLKIGDSLRKNPELSLNSKTAYEEGANIVATEHKVFTGGKASLLGVIEQDLKTSGQCRLYLANKPWGANKVALGLPKFSPIISIFNHEYTYKISNII